MTKPLFDIRIERLTRRYIDDELAAAHQSVEQTLPWIEWCHADLTRDELEPIFISMDEEWEAGESYTFAILATASNAFLGTVGLNRISKMEKTANLHYWVRTGSTGQGIATKAARLAIRIGLLEKGFQRISIIVPEGNRPSERVAERLGAQREGVLRNGCRLHGRQVNATVYSIVPEDLDRVLISQQDIEPTRQLSE